MYKVVVFFLLVSLQWSAMASKTLKPVISEDDGFDMGSVQPVLINDRILFAGSGTLWSLNTQDLTQQALMNGTLYQNDLFKPQFYRLGDHIYFLENRGTHGVLWRTDGTTGGTVLALDVKFTSEVNTHNGFLYGKDDQHNIIVSDGHQMVKHEVESDLLLSMCIFDLNNIIYPVYAGFGQSKDGVESNVGITLWGGFNYKREFLAQHNNACYVSTLEVESGSPNFIRNFWKIDPDGNKFLLNHVLPTGLTIDRLIAFKGQLYGAGTADHVSSLIGFDHQVSQVELQREVSTDPDFYNRFSTIGDYLISTDQSSGHDYYERTARFFDTDLRPFTERNYRVSFFNNPPSDFVPPAHQTRAESMVKIDTYVNRLKRESTLFFAPLNNLNNQLKLPENSFNHVISHQQSGEIYVLSEPDDGPAVLYQVIDSLRISNLINGSWFDPDRRNQGLVIRKGIRQDGSEYVMLTGFTFRNGAPLWVAGMAELQPPQESIQMTLYEYSGIGLFEPDSTPNQDPFGELELNMTSCNQIQANIVTSQDVIALDLHRIDDVTFTQNCED